jgi:hypothetical protein
MTCLIEKDIGSEELMSWECYEKVVHGKTIVGA